MSLYTKKYQNMSLYTVSGKSTSQSIFKLRTTFMNSSLFKGREDFSQKLDPNMWFFIEKRTDPFDTKNCRESANLNYCLFRRIRPDRLKYVWTSLFRIYLFKLKDSVCLITIHLPCFSITPAAIITFRASYALLRTFLWPSSSLMMLAIIVELSATLTSFSILSTLLLITLRGILCAWGEIVASIIDWVHLDTTNFRVWIVRGILGFSVLWKF